MKLVYHHRTASLDGQSTHITEMIGALRAQGHVVIECAPAVPEGAGRQGGGSPGWVGVLKRLLPRGMYELAELAYSLVAFVRLARLIRRERPDGIYERYNLYLLAGVWAKWWFGIPLVLEVNAPMAIERNEYGGLSWPRLAALLERFVFTRADQVLPVTEVLADHLRAVGVPSERICVIPNGINPAHFVSLPGVQQAKRDLGLEGRLVIGFTGFVREWDRLDRVMAWIGQAVHRHPVHLLVVGDGPARSDIEAAARLHGVTDRLSFTGVVPRESVPALSMAFDIALQTALVPYASPLCLFEYLALGKTILAPDQPNHHEVLRSGVDAQLFDAQAPDGIERALDAVCDDAELRERLGQQAARVIAERRLTWGDHARRVVAVFERLHASERRRHA